MLTIDVLTLFPGMFGPVLDESILARAQEKGLVSYQIHDIRSWTTDRHHVADDEPYGGGGGMVMLADPIVRGVEEIREKRALIAGPIIFLSPQGKPFNHDEAERLASLQQFTLLCGHYEGIDERVREGGWIDEELSVGDFVLTGGELGAMIVIDAVSRLLPGVLGNETSAKNDSFATGILDCPHYTRPEEYRGLSVPEVLRSGHHAKIDQWRRREALKRTLLRRPELLDTAALSEEDHRLLSEIRDELESSPTQEK